MSHKVGVTGLFWGLIYFKHVLSIGIRLNLLCVHSVQNSNTSLGWCTGKKQ